MFAFFAPIISGAVRHFFTAVAGILIARGYLQADQAASFVGASMFFFGFAWSCWQKLNQPEVLAHLTARVNARQAAAKKTFVGSMLDAPIVIAVVAIGAMAACLPTHADAQGWFLSQPAPVHRIAHKAKKAKPAVSPATFPEPMHAGLLPNLLAPSAPAASSSSTSQLDQLFLKIQQASVTDLQYAIALTNQAACSSANTKVCAQGVTPPAPTAASTAAGLRGQCLTAVLGVLTTVSSVQASTTAITGQSVSPVAPVGLATAFTRFEQLSEIADQLGPMSNVQTACAPIAQAIKMNTVQLVTGILAGGLGLGQLGVIPPIPLP